MAEILPLRVSWNYTALDMPMPGRFHILHVDPEPGYPFGRKGLALAGAWQQLSHQGQSGVLILDGDVVIDPVDYTAMLHAIHEDDAIVRVAPVRIWPVSTHRDDWVWSHWHHSPSQRIDAEARYFTFCFTYLPRRLLEAAERAGLREWTYPLVDRCMSDTAHRMGMRAVVVPGCHPKHINF